jgi:hypothetical protein
MLLLRATGSRELSLPFSLVPSLSAWPVPFAINFHSQFFFPFPSLLSGLLFVSESQISHHVAEILDHFQEVQGYQW